MFKSVTIKNFRALTSAHIDNLAQVNLLVGANNCGKTSILEALLLLTGAPNPHLPIRVNAMRGLITFHTGQLWRTFFHNMNTDMEISIRGNLNGKEELRLSIRPLRKESKSPSLVLSRASEENGINGLELTYSSTLEPEKENLARVFFQEGKLEAQGDKATSINGIMLSAQPMSDEWKGSFDEAQSKKRIPDLVKILKEIDPSIEDIRLNSVGMLEVDINLPHLLPLNLIGNGVLKLLNVVLLLSNFENGVVFIDEVDNGLHHSAQQILWKTIFECAEKYKVQVFATTHSYECVAAFAQCAGESLFKDQAKLYRIERKKDEIKSVEFDPDALKTFLENNWEMR